MTDFTTDTDELVALGELLLCLGQAFLPPRDAALHTALQDELVDDLRALDRTLSFTDTAHVDRLQRAIRDTAALEGGLLRVYSRLFLSPPFPAPINAGIHLDGALAGRSTLEMERIYHRHGLARDPEFRDLPDHLALQLQFVGWLHGRAAEATDAAERQRILGDARHFVEAFMLPWLPRWQAQLEEAVRHTAAAAAYRELAAVTEAALQHDHARLSALLPGSTEAPPAVRPTLDEALASRLSEADEQAEPTACRVCGEAFAPGADLAFMARQLETRGLEADHLYVCPDCRTGEMGLTPTRVNLPESARKGRVA
ncbi:molecular chaperone TorD family protein [Thioalkalivibrio sp. ARh3]|uniref:molecular chaperone TorD family protein n=1 Tax=Thioalkalivibrio sp. ARh3 TaxID=1158148 RepID=UPI00036641DF|nr:molecular chaperone TorD family protein [Thioalkalivibrio sp. ARh3]